MLHSQPSASTARLSILILIDDIMRLWNLLFCFVILLRGAAADRNAEPYQWLYFWSVFELDNRLNGNRRSIAPNWRGEHGRYTFDGFVLHCSANLPPYRTEHYTPGLITDPDDIEESADIWKNNNFFKKFNSRELTGTLAATNYDGVIEWFKDKTQEIRRRIDIEDFYVTKWRICLKEIHETRIKEMSGKFLENYNKHNREWAKYVVWYDHQTHDLSYRDIDYMATLLNMPDDLTIDQTTEFIEYMDTYREKSRNRTHIKAVEAVGQSRSAVEGPRPC